MEPNRLLHAVGEDHDPKCPLDQPVAPLKTALGHLAAKSLHLHTGHRVSRLSPRRADPSDSRNTRAASQNVVSFSNASNVV